jgi:hypothetical protein
MVRDLRGSARPASWAAASIVSHKAGRARFTSTLPRRTGFCIALTTGNGEICAALFEHCQHRLKLGPDLPLLSDRVRLGALLGRYKVGIG